MSFLVNLLISLPARIASYFAWAGPLIARLIVGYVFMLSGWTKLNNLPVMIERFTEWGIPAPQILTPFVSGVECFGGAMLILGLFTRIPAAMLAVVMLVVTYLAVFLWLAIAGPGAASLDYLLLRTTGGDERKT
ncbi:MAG: DoxX family protein [Afipia sp.]|nr:DoxX family protein [Afipia sp.]